MSIPRFMLVGGGFGPAAARRPAGFGWRLVGGNNYELGRSVTTADTVEECRAAVQRLKADVDVLTTRVRRGAAEAAWVWVVEADGVAVAASGRAYQRQRECQYALDHFLAAVPLADIVGDRRAPDGPGPGPAPATALAVSTQ